MKMMRGFPHHFLLCFAMRKIFVFGSNLAGIHGAGAAKAAYEHHGAIWGIGEGPQGDSYAIATKDYNVRGILSFEEILHGINRFIDYTLYNWDLEFIVTRIACGYSRYTDKRIAPLFQNAPDNCLYDDAWKPYLIDKRFWGTY